MLFIKRYFFTRYRIAKITGVLVLYHIGYSYFDKDPIAPSIVHSGQEEDIPDFPNLPEFPGYESPIRYSEVEPKDRVEVEEVVPQPKVKRKEPIQQKTKAEKYEVDVPWCDNCYIKVPAGRLRNLKK